MTAGDFKVLKFLELPWSILRRICLYLDVEPLQDLMDAPQLREMILDLLCHDKIKIFPAWDEIEVLWNGEAVNVNNDTMANFFKKYQEVSPRVYSVCVDGGFVYHVTSELHERLNRAADIEIWALKHSREDLEDKVTDNDLRLLLSYPGIRSVALDREIMHGHCEELVSLIPQITGLQSLKLEIKMATKLPILSRLKDLASLELCLDEVDAHTAAMNRYASTHEVLRKVFSQNALLPTFPTKNLNLPPLLKSLLLKSLRLTTVEVSSLPPTLETLDLSSNMINIFEYRKSNPRWPVNLRVILLQCNQVSNLSLKQLLSIQWPPSLQTLDLLQNYFTSLENLRNLPDSIEDLKLTGMLTSLQVSHNVDGDPFFRFPGSLRTLSLEPHERLSYDSYDTDVHESLPARMKFPWSLEHLTLICVSEENCLAGLIFPPSIKSLVLQDIGIHHLNSYNSLPGDTDEVNWSQLCNLTELNLNANKISTLADWYPPRLLRTLELIENQLDSLSSELTPLFDEQCSDLTRNIWSIDLQRNSIKSMDHKLYLPENLRKLNLSRNSLTQFAFTESFASHCYLLKLFLDHNPISKLSVHNRDKQYASKLQVLLLYISTHKISSADYDAVFQQLGLKASRMVGISWEFICRQGTFLFFD